MKSDIVAFRLRFCLTSLFLRTWRDKLDLPPAPIAPFGARYAWLLCELGDELGEKCVKENVVSFGELSGQLSSLCDGDREGEYADFRGGVFGQVISESLRENDRGGSTDSWCLVDVNVEFGNNNE